MEEVVQLLPDEERGLCHEVPHLDVVVHGEVADGLGVGAAVEGVAGEGRQAVARVKGHELVKDKDVLHSLILNYFLRYLSYCALIH